MNELDAFEKFKFNLGDLVAHVSDEPGDDPPRGIITSRALIQSPYGLAREYVVSFRASEVAVLEMELKAYQRPLRPIRG